MAQAPDSTMQFASAVSDDETLTDALEEVVDAVTDEMGDRAIDLAVAFASYHHARHFSAIGGYLERRLSPRAAMGTTAVGVVGSGYEIENRPGLSLLAARFGPGVWIEPITYESIRAAAALIPQAVDNAEVAHAAEARRRLLGGRVEVPAVLILLADPFSMPVMTLLPALNRALPGVPIVGGMASGASEAGDNRLLLNDTVYTEGAVALAIGGAVRVDCTVSQGCRPIGDPWLITQARHNLIQEIGRRPVLQVLQETADNAEPTDRALLEEYGLLVGRVINEYKDRFGRGDFLIRNIVGADPDAGYIAVSDLVRVGQTVQFHVRDRRTAEEDLRLLLQQQQIQGPGAGALLFSCNGRGRRLFNEPHAESKMIRGAIGDAPMAGFFAAGELGPIGDENFVHGFTASLAVFRPVERGG